MRKIAIALSLLAAIAPTAALAQNGSGVRIRITYYEPGQVIVGVAFSTLIGTLAIADV